MLTSPANAMMALSKPSLFQGRPSRNKNAAQKSTAGNEMYMQVMDGEDQRDKNFLRDQLRTAQDDVRKDRRSQDRKWIEGPRRSLAKPHTNSKEDARKVSMGQAS